MQHQNEYPGGSKTRVDKAGSNVRNNISSEEDLSVIDAWRAAHRGVLNTFQAILRSRTRGKNISVAQRHKRKSTIFNKLRRFSNMKLSRMDDVAGCRIIFDSIDNLYAFRDKFHEARFRHKRRNELDKYDYIKQPKDSGYRGIHDVYIYDVNSEAGEKLKGLYIEIQYRTLVQHAWATAVEVIGYITTSQPKFQQGDTRYITAMAYASEILARVYEDRCGPFPDLSDKHLLDYFLNFDSELSLLSTLDSLNKRKKDVSSNKNTILMFSNTGDLETKSFRDATDALKVLFELEKKHPERDIVLVKADTSEEIRIAFRNYFSDATDFLQLVRDAITQLKNRC